MLQSTGQKHVQKHSPVEVSLCLAPPWKQVHVYCLFCPIVTIDAEGDCTKLLSSEGG